MTAAEWETIIAGALLIEADAIPAADGSTPLTNLAERIHHIDPTDPEREAVIRALCALARDAHARPLPWTQYCNLLQLAELPGDLLRAELQRSLSRGVPNAPRERVQLMLTLTDLGQRFYPAELEAAERERTSCPEQWMDVAVRSECWDVADQYLPHMLREGLYDPSHLILRFSAWYQWNRPWLLKNVPSWLQDIPSSERDRISKWFTNRGIDLAAGPRGQGIHPGAKPTVRLPNPSHLRAAARAIASSVLKESNGASQ
jgi:hypothetical protein